MNLIDKKFQVYCPDEAASIQLRADAESFWSDPANRVEGEGWCEEPRPKWMDKDHVLISVVATPEVMTRVEADSRFKAL